MFGDLARIDVNAYDVMAQLGHPGGVGGAQIARAEDVATHDPCIGNPDEPAASGH